MYISRIAMILDSANAFFEACSFFKFACSELHYRFQTCTAFIALWVCSDAITNDMCGLVSALSGM